MENEDLLVANTYFKIDNTFYPVHVAVLLRKYLINFPLFIFQNNKIITYILNIFVLEKIFL